MSRIMCWCLIGSLCFSITSFSQVYKKETLKIVDAEKSFDKALPYDEEFIIAGNVGTRKGVCYVVMNYKLKDDKHSSLVLKKWQSGRAVTEINFDSVTFQLPCAGVAPNKTYQFDFEYYSHLSDTLTRRKIKQIIASRLAAFFFSNGFAYDANDLNTLSASIDTEIKKVLSRQILFILTVDAKSLEKSFVKVDKANPVFTFDKVKTEMLSFANTAFAPISDFSTNVKTPAGRLTKFFLSAEFKSYLTFLVDSTKYTNTVRQLIKSNIDTSDSRFKGFTIRNFSPPFADMTDSRYGDNMTSILEGRASFANFYVYPSMQPDKGLLVFLSKFLHQIRSIHFNDVEINKKFNDFSKQSLKDLADILKEIDKLQTAYTARDNFSNSIADILADYFIADNLIITDKVSTELANSSSPYISLDGGIGYNRGFQNFFSHYGVNFYAVPIKKRVPIRNYRANPMLYFLKTSSLSLGIINNYYDTDRNGPRYVSLLGGNKDLMIGIGHRLNRALKINVGSAFYFRKDADPQISSKTLQGKFVATLSLDVDLISGFTNVGKALNIIQ